MIRNRYLPLWLHRVCNGLFGAMLLIGIGSIWFGEPPGSWLYFVSRSLIWSSVPVGIILALVARRFSIVRGVAGRDGYDELNKTDDKKPVDTYEAHAVFALTFECEGCGRVMEFHSPHPEFSSEWYSELAQQARTERWFVPPADAQGKMDVMSTWCAECAVKPGFHQTESNTKL